jgi:hypothetical protein
MTRDEWEQTRKRAIEAAFQTGRPVFADSEGALCYADGDCEQLPIGNTELPIPDLSTPPAWWTRALRWLLNFGSAKT